MPNYGSLAQPVEQRTFNPLVARSNRARPTNKIKGLAKSLTLFYFLGLRGGYITKLTIAFIRRCCKQKTANFFRNKGKE